MEAGREGGDEVAGEAEEAGEGEEEEEEEEETEIQASEANRCH